MAKQRTPKTAEEMFYLFADALYSGDANETVGQVRDRIFRDAWTDDERGAFEKFVQKQREKFAKPGVVVEAEPANTEEKTNG